MLEEKLLASELFSDPDQAGGEAELSKVLDRRYLAGGEGSDEGNVNPPNCLVPAVDELWEECEVGR